MALLLSFDTATPHCAVVLSEDGRPIAQRVQDDGRLSHAEKLNVFIGAVMEEAGRELRDLDAIGVGTGPGSYTGLRIGLSAAKGLCYALGTPLLGLSTLGTLARAAIEAANSRDTTVQPMIDARRMEVFTGTFDALGHPLGGHHPLVLDEAWAQQAAGLVCGDGADKAAALWETASDVVHLPGVRPTAVAMITEAERRMAEGAFDDLAYLVPDYGKGANVTQPGKRQA